VPSALLRSLLVIVHVVYDVRERKLWVNEAEAEIVRMIFRRFVEVGSAITLVRELKEKDVRNKQGKHMDKCYLYWLLNNRVFLGEAVHKGESFKGEHEARIGR
jgi:site-specific DNA recombinase